MIETLCTSCSVPAEDDLQLLHPTTPSSPACTFNRSYMTAVNEVRIRAPSHFGQPKSNANVSRASTLLVKNN